MLSASAYLGLFITAFGAATLLPLQSEAVLVGLLSTGKFQVAALIAVATLGNVLGACVNWLLGRYIETWQDKPWFPFRPEQIGRVQVHYHRYGRWSLLMSWMPIIGDPLTLIAGVMREPFPSFLLLVTLAKLARYVFLAVIAQGVMG
jgi:membrane protein YqaA with SNARE-associated domain